MPIGGERVVETGVSKEVAVNAITTADKQVLLEVANPKSSFNAGKSAWPKGESTLDIEAVRARAEAVTAVLQEILQQNPSLWNGGSNEPGN